MYNLNRVDSKFNIAAHNMITGEEHDSLDSVLFLARDRCFLKYALPAYIKGCKESKCSKEFMQRIRELRQRITRYQKDNKLKVKIPD